MTLKEAIGRFAAKQVIFRCHRILVLGLPQGIIDYCQGLANDVTIGYKSGTFQIMQVENDKETWVVAPGLPQDDTETSNKLVMRAKSALSYSKQHEPLPILKLITEDGTRYYFDGVDRLTTNRDKLGDINHQVVFRNDIYHQLLDSNV